MFTSNDTAVPIYSDDNEHFRKCREISNKINELIGINNPTDFVEINLYDDDDDDDDEFIMVYLKYTASVRYNDKNRLVIVLHSFFLFVFFLFLFYILFFINSLKHH